MEHNEKEPQALFIGGRNHPLHSNCQEEMLPDYAEKQGFLNPLFLYDDGVSETKTNRLGFPKVLAMIREGLAATLIVTDLTRLYRNQLEADNLLEIVFFALGVRFIAITNNYYIGMMQ